MLDVFNTDAFSSIELTEAIDKLPYKPGRLGELGLFQEKNIATTDVSFEERQGTLSLIQSSPRGSVGSTRTMATRKQHKFNSVHIQTEGTILAAQVQNLREFGGDSDSLSAVMDVVNDELELMKQDLEATLEWQRMGAIKGVVLDADGTTTLLNMFTHFGISELTVNFDFTAGAQDMQQMAASVIRQMRQILGGSPFKRIRAFCSDTFFDAFVTHATVKGEYGKLQNAAQTVGYVGEFEFGGIIWENYTGGVGGTDFITAGDCRFVPEGVPGLFRHYNTPADYVEAVNTLGKPWYAKQELMKFGKGVELEAQTNPIMLCTRPRACIRGY